MSEANVKAATSRTARRSFPFRGCAGGSDENGPSIGEPAAEERSGIRGSMWAGKPSVERLRACVRRWAQGGCDYSAKARPAQAAKSYPSTARQFVAEKRKIVRKIVSVSRGNLMAAIAAPFGGHFLEIARKAR